MRLSEVNEVQPKKTEGAVQFHTSSTGFETSENYLLEQDSKAKVRAAVVGGPQGRSENGTL